VIIYRKILSRDSTRCDVPYDLGTALMKVKEYQKAVEMFDRKIACDTSGGYQFASHLNAAMSLMQLKKFDAASGYIKKSIQVRPENIQAWQTLAQCDLQIGDVDEAIVNYKKVIEIANDAAEHGEEGKYAAQLEEATRMIGVEYLIMATKAKEEAGKKLYQQSLEYLKKAVALKPTVEVLLYTAQAAQNSNNKEDAKKYYCKIIKSFPNSPEAKKAQQGLEILNMKCDE
jgi:tetratricopeptide (TPR) repeat protein